MPNVPNLDVPSQDSSALIGVEIKHTHLTVMHTCLQSLQVHSHPFTHIFLFSLSVPHLVFSDLFFCPPSETSSPHIIPSLSGFKRGVRTFPVLKAHRHASINWNQHTVSLLWSSFVLFGLCLFCCARGVHCELGSPEH